jgi:hypothetical protein
MGNRRSFLGVKRPGREADPSPPPSADVKEWVGLYLQSPKTPLWRDAQLKAQGQLYLYLTHIVTITHLFFGEYLCAINKQEDAKLCEMLLVQ